ncbi:unnamed protein product [Microthlaspi erraticum]|uniref:KIB1-4 beta-propeller domain-containing protein n=1 Tax=Microthlaspi erraticum TaxID=1685480 RepID=A0A6D2J0R3_9BRAS|nr:unnamed protein product [Microthlaspi erraticum]
MAESVAKKRTSASSSMMPDWTKLPEELFEVISEKLNNCFDVVHARSVCSLWRSTMPFPCSLLRPSYSLPSFTEVPHESKGFCTIKKIPLFFFIVRPTLAAGDSPSESYFYGGIGRRDESEDHMEMIPSPLQCSVKVTIGESEATLMNMLDCEILPLGHQYRMIGLDSEECIREVAVLPLGGGEFIVLLNLRKSWLVLRSGEMKWMVVKNFPFKFCKKVVAFRGRFYAMDLMMGIVVIDPYSLEVTPLMQSQPLSSRRYLIPCGNDELFLVEQNGSQLKLRVSRLDEEAGKWVVVTHVGDRVLFISHGHLGNVCCSAKELPDGCGLSGNSILFNFTVDGGSFFFRYRVHTGFDEDNLSFWILSAENPVTILSTSPVLALRVKL